MKTLEEIEEEYKNFQLKSDFIKSGEDLSLFLLVGVEDTYAIEDDNNKEIRANNRNKTLAKVGQFLLFSDDNSDVDFFEQDNEILFEINKLTEDYRNMYLRIIDLATDDNYSELTKLVDFCTEYYNYHIDYFESERDALEMYMKGICMCNPKYSDNRTVINEFVDKKLRVYDKGKVLEKKV